MTSVGNPVGHRPKGRTRPSSAARRPTEVSMHADDGGGAAPGPVAWASADSDARIREGLDETNTYHHQRPHVASLSTLDVAARCAAHDNNARRCSSETVYHSLERLSISGARCHAIGGGNVPPPPLCRQVCAQTAPRGKLGHRAFSLPMRLRHHRPCLPRRWHSSMTRARRRSCLVHCFHCMRIPWAQQCIVRCA